jgi:hypothetical protein
LYCYAEDHASCTTLDEVLEEGPGVGRLYELNFS